MVEIEHKKTDWALHSRVNEKIFKAIGLKEAGRRWKFRMPPDGMIISGVRKLKESGKQYEFPTKENIDAFNPLDEEQQIYSGVAGTLFGPLVFSVYYTLEELYEGQEQGSEKIRNSLTELFRLLAIDEDIRLLCLGKDEVDDK